MTMVVFNIGISKKVKHGCYTYFVIFNKMINIYNIIK